MRARSAKYYSHDNFGDERSRLDRSLAIRGCELFLLRREEAKRDEPPP